MPYAAAPIFKNFDDSEREILRRTAQNVLTEVDSPLNPKIWNSISKALTSLPDPLLEKLGNVSSPSGLTIFHGAFSVHDVEVGPTPEHWSKAHGDEFWDVLVLLLSATMGRPISRDGQQEGRFVHNIVPSLRQETTRLSDGTGLLNPHTQDASHPDRAQLLILACMRNSDAVPTAVASIRHVSLGDEDVDILMRPHLPILADPVYTPAPFDGEPIPVPVLWSTDEGLMMRFDPSNTPLSDGSPEFCQAYANLSGELAKATLHCSLGAGDILVVENDVVAHDQVPFRARYDGTDRWLKRTMIRTKDGVRRRPGAEAREHGYGYKLLIADLP